MPDGHPAEVLGPGAEVCVVVAHHRHAESRGQGRRERRVHPPEVGREPHDAIAEPDGARHGDADPEAASVGILAQHVFDHLGEGLHHLEHVVVAALVRALATRHHLAAEGDAGHGDPVDPEVDADRR